MSASEYDPVETAYELVSRGCAARALPLIEPLAAAVDADHRQLAAYASVLRSLGRSQESLKTYERAVRTAPHSGLAEHNLAAILEQLGRFADAEAASRRALAKGMDAPEVWAVLARCLQAQDQHDDAERAYREALRRCPTMADVQRDLAQLIWMRTGDVVSATAALREAIASLSFAPELTLQLGTALRYAGQEGVALSILKAEIDRAPHISPDLEVAAASTAAAVKDFSASEWHARRAVESAPHSSTAILALCDAFVAQGRPAAAAPILESLHARLPHAQQVTARLTTVWRLIGDARYRVLCDYDTLVAGWTIEIPTGWPSLQSYLTDLAAALRAFHTVRAHPFDQSLRGGTQTHADLAQCSDPVIRAFFQAVDEPIRCYINDIAAREEPLRQRGTVAYRIHSAWSVRLRPAGFHVNHVHQYGWLSSACHIEVPAVVDHGGQEGWLKLGEPGIATQPPLSADRLIRPQPGRLILFPSYIWHGTVPFSGDSERLSIGLDVVPV